MFESPPPHPDGSWTTSLVGGPRCGEEVVLQTQEEWDELIESGYQMPLAPTFAIWEEISYDLVDTSMDVEATSEQALHEVTGILFDELLDDGASPGALVASTFVNPRKLNKVTVRVSGVRFGGPSAYKMVDEDPEEDSEK